MTSRFVKFLIRQDIFGHRIGVNYKGKETYQTPMGALCTILYFVLVIVNSGTLFIAFLDNSNMTSGSQQMTFDPFEEPAFSLSDYNSKVAMLVLNEPDLRIGRVDLFQHHRCDFGMSTVQCIQEGRLQIVEQVDCTDEQLEKLADYYIPRIGEELFEMTMKKLYKCFNLDNLELQSEDKTRSYKSIKAVYRRCREYTPVDRWQ